MFAAQPGSLAGLLFGFMASLPLFLVGFSGGRFQGVAAAGSALVAIVFAAGAIPAIYYAVVNALPACLIIWLMPIARERFGFLISALALYGSLVICLAAVAFMGEPGGLQAVLREATLEMLQQTGPVSPTGTPINGIEQLAEIVALVFPASAATGSLLLLMGNAVLGQALVKRFATPVYASPDLAEMRVSKWAPHLLAMTIAGGFLPGSIGYLASNISVLAAIPFLFAGLAVIHSLLRRTTWTVPGLTLIYLLVLLFMWPALIVIFVGLMDLVFDFRRGGGQPSPPDD